MGTELLSSLLSTHAPRPQIDPTVGSGPRADTTHRCTTKNDATFCHRGALRRASGTASQHWSVRRPGAAGISNNTRGRGTASATTRQVLSATGTIAPGPVASQAVEPAYVAEEAVSGNVRGKSTATSEPISALSGAPSGSGRLSRSNSLSNTADVGPLYQAKLLGQMYP